jgi:iron(III) transport system ATP-binding protein
LRLLCGFEYADSGTIQIGGRTVYSRGVHLPPEQRDRDRQSAERGVAS